LRQDAIVALEIAPMQPLDKVLYTARTHTQGGREGSARSSDGRLDVRLTPPGSSGDGTNPEQLFAAGWSACFLGAIRLAASKMKIVLPTSPAVDAEVDLGMRGDTFELAARLTVSLPGVDRAVARQLLEAAHETCPYSRAIRNNIAVSIELA
jgi:osmotically inducible protein OsmC